MATGASSWIDSDWAVWADQVAELIGPAMADADLRVFYPAWEQGASPVEAVGTWDARRWEHQTLSVTELAQRSGLSVQQLQTVLPPTAAAYGGADLGRAVIARWLLERRAAPELVRATVASLDAATLRGTWLQLQQISGTEEQGW